MKDLIKRFPRYSKLLYLYPVSYREQYGEQMLQTLADMLDDPQQSRASTWVRISLDFPLSVVKQQVTYTGEAMATTMPSYIKRNAVLGAWLVAPFFLFIILNGILGDRLYHSWFWHTRVLFIWLIVLPSLAVLFNLVSWLRWVQSRRRETKKGTVAILADVRRSWPALAMVVMGVGILGIVFFHDSVHCITGNPIRELHNPSQTWHCVQQR